MNAERFSNDIPLESSRESVEKREEIDARLLKNAARDMVFAALYDELGNSKLGGFAVGANGAGDIVAPETLRTNDTAQVDAAREQVFDEEARRQEEAGYLFAPELRGLSAEERGNLFDQFTLQIEAEEARKALDKTRKAYGKESNAYAHAHARWMNVRAARKIEEEAFSPRVRQLYLEGKFGNIASAKKAYASLGRFVATDHVFESVRVARGAETQQTQEAVIPESSPAARMAVAAGVDSRIAETEAREIISQFEEAMKAGDEQKAVEALGVISDAARALESLPSDISHKEKQALRDKMLLETGEVALSGETMGTQIADSVFIEQVLEAVDRDEAERRGELEESRKRVLTRAEAKAPLMPEEIEKKLEKTVTAVSELLPPKEIKTGLISRIRGFARRHLIVLSAAGALSFLAAKKIDKEVLGQAYYHPTVQAVQVELLERIPQIPFALKEKPDLLYGAGSMRRAEKVGVDHYLEYLTRHAIKSAGFQSVAARMFERDLSAYMQDYEATWRKNRYTSINENTMDLYMREFAETYLQINYEKQPEQFYAQFSSFLRERAGAEKAQELNRMILEKWGSDISNPFVAKVFEESAAMEKFLEMAKGKCNIFFNEEEGIMQVVYGNVLIDTYSSRAGSFKELNDAYMGGMLRKFGYSRLPDGIHKIKEIKQNHTTLRWRSSVIPHLAKLRYAENDEVQYERNGEWLYATGPNAIFFDHERKVEPNKTKEDRIYWASRSKGQALLEKTDFEQEPGILRKTWTNPFGEATILIAGRGEAIHTNPTQSELVLGVSHGCLHLTTANMRKIVPWVSSSSKIEVTAEKGKTWKESALIVRKISKKMTTAAAGHDFIQNAS